VSLYDPDLWTDEFAFPSRLGQGDIQMDLFYDYRTNVASYPAWQEWLRRHQPPLPVLWGCFDASFLVDETEAYRRDVPSAEVHILDVGHFALDEQPATVSHECLEGSFYSLGVSRTCGQGASRGPKEVPETGVGAERAKSGPGQPENGYLAMKSRMSLSNASW
jgi:hypothetical protein